MGQAWCKERTTKAQDSKSPLDRVFVRCAHQIYPSLKEDGSVLGGATQRVTSSEIGYAGSPPREILTRVRSMDSVDRPFHPSEWVDVNLEVPSTPSSVITNLTANASRYPTTATTTTTEPDSKYVAPIPPPRHRRKNRGRPLPPKPDDIPETHENGKSVSSPKKDEPLYSSVKPKHRDADDGKSVEAKNVGRRIETIGDKNESVTDVPGKLTEEISRKRRSKDIQEREVNGSIERTIASSRKARGDHREDSVVQGDASKSIGDVVGYDRFAESEKIRSSSTPRDSKATKELREYVSGATIGGGDILDVVHHRPKNRSTISLPSYDELESVKSAVERIDETSKEDESVAPKKPGRTRNVSTISLPPGSISQRTTERLADYISRCRSFGSLQPEEIVEKLKSQSEMDDGTSEEDDWDDLDDWDIDQVEQGGGYSDGRSPVEPSSRLVRPRKFQGTVPRFELGGEPMVSDDEETGEARRVADAGEKRHGEPEFRRITRNASFELPRSPDALRPALKDEAKRKTSMPPKFPSREADSSLDEWFTAQERSVRFFDPPPAEDEYANAPGHRPSRLKIDNEPADTYDPRTRSYNGIPPSPFDIDTFFDGIPTFGEAIGKTESGAGQSEKIIRKVLTRSLSNESEPFDGYEEKELTLDIRSQSSMGGGDGGGGGGGDGGGITKTISAESIPREMQAEDYFEEASASTAKEEENRSARSRGSRTPPSSPEPKIRVEIQEAVVMGRGASKRLKDEEGESNLSSMTPSLTELEADLSDMLEKEDHDGVPEDVPGPVTGDASEVSIEPKIVPSDNRRGGSSKNHNNNNNYNNKNNNNNNEIINEGRCRKRATSEKISLDRILNDRSSPERRVASRMTDELLKVVGNPIPVRSTPKNPFEEEDEEEEEEAKFAIVEAGSHTINPFDEPPEKPSRLQKFLVDRDSRLDVSDVPSPPRRKNKHGGDVRGATEFPIASSAPHPNDRLI